LSYWEDLHPLSRNNIAIMVVAMVVWVTFQIITYAAPRLLTLHQVFQWAIIERLWTITGLVLIAVLVFNALRLLMRFARREVSWMSAASAWAVIGVVVYTTFWLPSFFNSTVSYVMGQSYGDVYNGFETLCDKWEERYRDEDTITLRISDEDLGLFENRAEVDVRRERNVVFFDFGDEEQEFGLACAIGGEEPHSTGRARDYEYHHINQHYYQYIDQPDQ
jgi:hypothetical protein